MKGNVFITADGVGGHLEHVGQRRRAVDTNGEEPKIPGTLVRTMFRYLFWMYVGYLIGDWTLALFAIR
jgi:hypothetical protein